MYHQGLLDYQDGIMDSEWLKWLALHKISQMQFN
jgi:hypothetical protein